VQTKELHLHLPIGGRQNILSVQPNKRRSYLFIKRLTDIVVSGVALAILSPVFFVVAVAIKLEDPAGKAVYRQLRTGKAGIPFWIHKFRSMYNNADAVKELLKDRNEMGGPVFKIRDDPRVTKIGKIIRKLSIDEIPQFFNVFKGDLSLVGPRPLPVEEADACDFFQKQREFVKPGLTCTWQISGRNNISFERWMEMDIEYIAKQSLRTDFVILVKTVPAVLLSRGAS